MKLTLRFNLRDPKLVALIAHSREHYAEQRECWPSTKALTKPQLLVVKDSGAYLMSPFPLVEGEAASLRARAHNADGGLLVVYAAGCGPEDEWIGGDDFGELFEIPEIRPTDTTLIVTLTDKWMTITVEGPAKPSPQSCPSLARVVQLIGNYFGGTLSLGVGRLENLNCTNGDNGVFRVKRSDNAPPQIDQSRSGKLSGPWVRLDNEQIHKHPYYHPTKDDAKPILQSIIDANAMFAE